MTLVTSKILKCIFFKAKFCSKRVLFVHGVIMQQLKTLSVGQGQLKLILDNTDLVEVKT